MASFAAFALYAAAASTGVPLAAVHVPTKAASSAQASARILSGAKVSLSASAQPDGHKRTVAEVTLEDGRRRQAHLVEFQ